MRRRQPATASRTTALAVILRILRRLHHAPASHTSWVTRAPTSCRVRRWRRGEPRADGTWRLWKIWDGLRDRIDVAARRGGRCTADIYGREGAVSGLYCRPWQHGLTTASIDQPKRKFARCGRRGGGGWIRRHVTCHYRGLPDKEGLHTTYCCWPATQNVDMDLDLLAVTDAFLRALSESRSQKTLLAFFSTTSPVSIQHAPRVCPNPHTSRLHGHNAIRSYFDLLDTHWYMIAIKQHSKNVVTGSRTVTISASVTWRWKKSGRTWNEDFTCTLVFDDHSKISRFFIATESDPTTCVMRAIDEDPPSSSLNSSTASVSESFNFIAAY